MATLLPQIRSRKPYTHKPDYDAVNPASLTDDAVILWDSGVNTKDIAEILGAERDAFFSEAQIIAALALRPKARAAA